MQKVSSLVSKDIGNYLTNRATWSIVYVLSQYATGNGTTDDAGSINTLITSIGSDEATIVVDPGTYRCGSAVTVPSNITLWFLQGGMLSPDSGDTITINGPVEAGIWKIFTGSGTIAGSMEVETLYPQWWGAKGDGVTPDSSSIQKSFDFAYINGNSIFVPEGVYYIDAQLNYRPHVHIYGVGVNSRLESYITNGYVLNFDLDNEATGPHNVVISGIYVSGTNHSGTGGGIAVTGSAHAMVIEQCWVNNFNDTNQVGIYGYGDLYYFTIKECNLQNDYIAIKFDGTGAGVNNCGIENCKITTGTTGISLLFAPNTYIKNCQVEQFNIGIDCQSNYCQIETCWLEQNETADIRFKNCNQSYANNLYTYRTPAHTAQYSIKFETAVKCVVRNSYFNNRTGANKPIFFDLSTQNTIDNIGMDDSSNVYHTGTLGSNIVKTIITTGVLNRTEIPQQFYGGIWLDETVPSNVQNGVMYRSGEGLILRTNSLDYRLNALSKTHVSKTTAPTTGTYAVGDVAWNTAPTLLKNISHWTCITAGSPGVWTAHGCGTGTTANRPTLGANDAGYLYRDTTTSTLIFWNGTAWV